MSEENETDTYVHARSRRPAIGTGRRPDRFRTGSRARGRAEKTGTRSSLERRKKVGGLSCGARTGGWKPRDVRAVGAQPQRGQPLVSRTLRGTLESRRRIILNPL